MKKLILTLSILGTVVAYAATNRNGLYRGTFVSGQETQVEVQFDLKNDVVENAKFRTLAYKDQDYLKNKELELEKAKYEAALKATDGKKLSEALELLYTPANIEKAGASVRATKIRAAMQNAVNSGVYAPAK
ncbi:hypothetical protein H3N56_05900 [Cetobacterium sp. 2A]|uniref:hypothetical protein n=2 Tax=unclassified Cetobacterium TaxID=2630983 RepID=UPI00163C4C44|nr:hypothetical protein [Cetobacterium sp. 2A]MBC2856023.1 hypothetical protein [Cetobacterium sp. 2A]